ncbi:MAG: patatin-like phospholipase family protein [Streptosporangiaceae bacterium]
MGAVVLEAATRRASPRHIGLVFGAGGITGAAWMTGALPALQDRLPSAIGDVALMAGTSAGSVLAASLRCGCSVEELTGYQRGEAAGDLAALPPLTDGPLPPLPQPRMGSPALWYTALLAPYRVHPRVGATAWLPHGRGRHTALRTMIGQLHARHHGLLAPPAAPDPLWVDGATWIVAVDYDSGRRVVFGRGGAPAASLPDAVVASCSIPGWYRPAEIGGRRYVDGGIQSLTSLGLMAEAGVDEVYVLAPMASTVTGRSRSVHERLERAVRGRATRTLLRDARRLHARGITVTVLTPGREDLAAMGVNPMDARRREAVLESSLRTSPASLARPRVLASRPG